MSKTAHPDAAEDNAMQIKSLPETGFVRLPLILQHVPISKSTWWAGVREGRYPPPVKISAACTAWRAESIHALIASLGAEGES